MGKVQKKNKRLMPTAKESTHLVVPHHLKRLQGVRIRFVASGHSACHCIAVDVNGLCFAWGRNESGQLGLNDFADRNEPTMIEELVEREIIAASCGKKHTALVASDGISWTCGWNGMGQCGTGFEKGQEKSGYLIKAPREALVRNCISVVCGSEFTLWLCDGLIFAAGNPQDGVMGDGSQHQYNAAQATIKLRYDPIPVPQVIKVLEHRRIIAITAGPHHCLAIDSDGIPYSWGNGNNGRLGHEIQQDEFTPRPIESLLERPKVDLDNLVIAAGGTTSFCTTTGGMLYSWGLRKTNGECEMYPRPFYDFQGWKIRSMSCGQGTFAVAAEQSVMTWGRSLHGENAQGPSGKKSCANPEKCSSLEDVYTHQVACGLGFNLFLVDPEDEKISQLPVYDPEAPDEFEKTDANSDAMPTNRNKRRKKSAVKRVSKKPQKKRSKKPVQTKIKS